MGAFSSFAQCATWGAWQEISQRWPFCAALHMLPVRPVIEFVVLPVPSVVTELVTLDWLSSMTEPAVPDDVFADEAALASREMTVSDVPFDTAPWAILVQSINAANVMRCFIAVLQSVSQSTREASIGPTSG